MFFFLMTGTDPGFKYFLVPFSWNAWVKHSAVKCTEQTVFNRIEVLPVQANEAFPLKINVPTRRWTVNRNFWFIDAFFVVIFNNSVDHAYCSSKSKKWILRTLTPLRMHKKVGTFVLLRWDFYVTSSVGQLGPTRPNSSRSFLNSILNGGKPNSKITVKKSDFPYEFRLKTLHGE